MAICTRLFEQGLMVRLSDEIDLFVRDDLRDALLPLVDSPVAIIDITDVTYSDTTLLNAIITLAKRRSAAGNDLPLRIAGASSHVRRILALTHVDQIVCFYGSIKKPGLVASRSASKYRRASEVHFAASRHTSA